MVLWLNGGPGCSSFDGLIYEHGPFLFGFEDPNQEQSRLVLKDNPHRWCKAATMIYLDSPSGWQQGQQRARTGRAASTPVHNAAFSRRVLMPQRLATMAGQAMLLLLSTCASCCSHIVIQPCSGCTAAMAAFFGLPGLGAEQLDNVACLYFTRYLKL